MIIETERLHLRPLGLADIDEFVALHGDAGVTRFIRRFEQHEAEDRLRLFAREWVERGHGMFAVLDRASGRFLGRAGLKYWPQFDESSGGCFVATRGDMATAPKPLVPAATGVRVPGRVV